jgi:hypothetical protein
MWYCSSVTVIGNQNFKLLVEKHGQDTKTESYLHRFNMVENNYGTYTCHDVTTLGIFQETLEQNVKFQKSGNSHYASLVQIYMGIFT